MDAFLYIYERLLFRLGQIEKFLGIGLLIAITISILLQVFFRYVLEDPLIWVMEFSIGCFVWCTFLCVSYALKNVRHITIISFTVFMSERSRALVRMVAYLIILVICSVMVYYAIKVTGIESRTTTVSLPIDISKSWLYSVPVLAGSLLSAITGIYLLLAEARAFISGDVTGPVQINPST